MQWSHLQQFAAGLCLPPLKTAALSFRDARAGAKRGSSTQKLQQGKELKPCSTQAERRRIQIKVKLESPNIKVTQKKEPGVVLVGVEGRREAAEGLKSRWKLPGAVPGWQRGCGRAEQALGHHWWLELSQGVGCPLPALPGHMAVAVSGYYRVLSSAINSLLLCCN